MKNMIQVLSLFILLVFNGCSCSEQKLSKEALTSMVLKADPNARIIIPENIDEGVKCGNYPPGCQRGYAVKVKGLEMIFVEYQSKETARMAAEKIGQYYFANWLLDDVTDEPILEDFAEKELSAQRSRNAGKRKTYFEANKDG